MKVQLTVTGDDGVIYAGEVELSVSPSEKSQKLPVSNTATPSSSRELNFDLPLRPFMKMYSQSMSGPKRLTLLVAWLAKGKTDVQVQRASVLKAWNKMKALMGGAFNSAYETRARDGGWLHSPKAGVYTLLPNWRNVV